MPLGAGKYDAFCTTVREAVGAVGVAVIVIEGRSGSGFSVQGPPAVTKALPRLLRTMADEIDAAILAGTEGV